MTAHILRNSLSGCVFLGSHTPEYAPRRKASPSATCSHLRRHISGITGVCL